METVFRNKPGGGSRNPVKHYGRRKQSNTKPKPSVGRKLYEGPVGTPEQYREQQGGDVLSCYPLTLFLLLFICN